MKTRKETQAFNHNGKRYICKLSHDREYYYILDKDGNEVIRDSANEDFYVTSMARAIEIAKAYLSEE